MMANNDRGGNNSVQIPTLNQALSEMDPTGPRLPARHTDTPVAERHHTRRRVGKALTRPLATRGCQTIMLPKVGGPRGNLTFIEQTRHIPFEIKRVYYMYDIPGGASRGGHAHWKLCQFMIALSGSFDIVLDDGANTDILTMNRSYCGLYIPNMIWRELINFSSGSVCIVLASDYYEELDYIRDHDTFLQAVRLGHTKSGN